MGLPALAELRVIVGLFGLKLLIHAHFWEFWGYDGVPLGIGHRPKGSNTRVLGLQMVEKVLR